MPTLTITNLGGPLTRKNDGDLNSGLAKFETSHGYNPFVRPGNLTWFEQPSSIFTGASIQGTLIAAAKDVSVSNSDATYAFDNSGTLRKFIIGNPSGSVIGALPNSPSTADGCSMVFFGDTPKIFFYSQALVQKINLNGSGGASIIGTSSIVNFVPRPMQTFLGKIYFGNGNNVGEIDSTETITTGTKLSPGLPSNVVIQDLDVTPDGNYLQMTATENTQLGGFITTTGRPGYLTRSYRFLWNGTDSTYSAFSQYPGDALLSNESIGPTNFQLGYDTTGAGIYIDGDKTLALPNVILQYFPATFAMGNALGFVATEYDNKTGVTNLSLFYYGSYDKEVQPGLYRFLNRKPNTRTNVLSSQVALQESNLVYRDSYSGFADNIAGKSRVLFSDVESSSSVTGQYLSRFWRFETAPIGTGSIVAGVYETQSQLFSKKVNVKEVRIYTDPLAGGNDFEVDVIGSGGSVLAGGSKKFAVGTTVTAGQDMVQYNPQSAPTYAVGIRVTNASVTGVRNWTASKIEVDWEEAGK